MASNTPVPLASAAAPAAPPVPPVADPKAAEYEAKLRGDLKDLLLYELEEAGYRPNPADVKEAVNRLYSLVTDAGGSAASYATLAAAKLKAYSEHVVAEAKAKGEPPPEPLHVGAPVPSVPAKKE
jgi:hypothetical protein